MTSRPPGLLAARSRRPFCRGRGRQPGEAGTAATTQGGRASRAASAPSHPECP
ncbi:hypothetical protein GN316_13565 [Xylophilus sp. Kf1]|nr:hypothetical protein [Xylophilus sp. Kf1]